MTKVEDFMGHEIDFDAAANMMDDDIVEDMVSIGYDGSEDPQTFIEEYAEKHHDKFNEDFAPYYGLAW